MLMSFHAPVKRSILEGSRSITEGRHSILEGRRSVQGDMSGISSAERLDLRQIRHHTKNALQGLIAQIDQTMELQETKAGRRLARELQHRILLSARVSDALFGFTGAPQALEARLRSLCENVVRLFGASGQDIRTEVTVYGICPVALHEAILRSVHEMVGNAVKHGLRARVDGLISVRLETSAAVTTLTVQDNGWGFKQIDQDGQGLEIIHDLIARHAGSLRLYREETVTTAILTFSRYRSSFL